MSKTDDQLRRATEHLSAYRARQDRIVDGLSEIKRALDIGEIDHAREAMNLLLATDLKQAQDRVGNWTMALRVAVSAIGESANTPASRNAVLQIKKLAPEAFVLEPAELPS